MNTIFLNSEFWLNSKSSDSHRPSLNLTAKIELRRKDKCTAITEILAFIILKKIQKSNIRIINLKFHL